MKTAFILAGFDLHETATSPDYLRLRTGLTEQGYHVIPIDISWKHKTPSQYVDEFISTYKSNASDENIIIGNSFGAVVTFIAAPKIKADRIFLCSLSPFFKEDRGKQPDSLGLKYFGKKRMNDLWSYSATLIANSVKNSKVYVLYGEKEHQTSPILVGRCKDTAKNIINASLIEIKGAPHDMSDGIYTNAILELTA